MFFLKIRFALPVPQNGGVELLCPYLSFFRLIPLFGTQMFPPTSVIARAALQVGTFPYYATIKSKLTFPIYKVQQCLRGSFNRE